MRLPGTSATAISAGALTIAVFSVLSRLAGVVRDRLLAHTFGAGTVLDAYYAAFKVPDFIFNTIVLGAVASAFIPVFVRLRQHQPPEAERLVHTMFTALAGTLAFWALLAALFARPLMTVIAPGFDPERLALAVQLTRPMLIAMVFFGTSNVVGSVLQAQQRFAAFAAAPIAYNLGIITGIYLIVPVLGAAGLAWGVVLGSVLHLALQLPAFWRSGYSLRLRFSFRDPGLRHVAKLLAPRTLGLGAAQLNQLVTSSFISHLSVGTLAAFTLATNLQSFPINVFGVSLAVAAFPVFSQALNGGSREDFTAHFRDGVRRVLFFVLPLSLLFLVLRAQIVRVVLGSGAFDWGDTLRTAQALGYLALAMVSDSLVPLVARAFYALQDTRTPVVISLLSILVNITLLFILKPLGLPGVGIAYASASVCNLVLLLAVLGSRLEHLGADEILRGVQRMVLAALGAGATAYATLHLVAPLVDMHTFVGIAVQGIAAGLVGVGAYLVITLALQLPEVNFVRRWLASAWRTAERIWTSP